MVIFQFLEGYNFLTIKDRAIVTTELEQEIKVALSNGTIRFDLDPIFQGHLSNWSK